MASITFNGCGYEIELAHLLDEHAMITFWE